MRDFVRQFGRPVILSFHYRWPVLSLALCLSGLSGCGRRQIEAERQFGALHRPASTTDLNGLGVHQKLWESAGVKCVMPSKLSPLLDQFDAIVLVGTTHSPPGRDARDWLEDWLAQAEGRSVIYFGRDFDAEPEYRKSTLTQVSTEKRMRAEVIHSLRTAEKFASKTAEVSQPAFCRWFLRGGVQSQHEVKHFQGPWADTLSGGQVQWPVAVTLEPPTSTVRSRMQSALLSNIVPANPKSGATNSSDDDSMVYRSIWSMDEISTPEELDAEWEWAPEAEVLLSGGADQPIPLVTRLSSDDFENSQILIVANGAPFLNGSLVNRDMRKLSARIVQQCLPAKRVAFLQYGEDGILISEVQEQDPRLAGLELLTVWPLNVIVMHAALLGILVCIVLLPVLGRPQPAPRKALSDFGEHVEAMGSMLLRTRDLGYAHRTVSEYFRCVRNESVPNWIPLHTMPSQARNSPDVVQTQATSSTIPVNAPQVLGSAQPDAPGKSEPPSLASKIG